MKWSSAVSEEQDVGIALDELAIAVDRGMGGMVPDLILVFATPNHAEADQEIANFFAQHFPEAVFLGCTAGGVVGGGHEVEQRSGLSLTAASLPGVTVDPFYLGYEELGAISRDPVSWYSLLEAGPGEEIQFLLFPDPFTCDTEALIGSIDEAFPRGVQAGGMASGARAPGENVFWLDDKIHHAGALGVALRGDVAMDTIVAQGCRPIGPPLFVTLADSNRLLELDGRPPTEILAEVHEELDVRDRALFRHSLFLGIVMRPGQSEYQHGDFLIRNLVGVDPESGTLVVGEKLERGQVVQLHLRDAATSTTDLRAMIDRHRRITSLNTVTPSGALLFSCLGRGENLYGVPDHDSRLLQEGFGAIPIGGFFCNGEIGPVQGRTFVHGYTSSVALFRSRS